MKLARWALVVVLAGLVPAKAFAVGPGPAATAAPTFEQLVELGDKARAARRWAEAVIAYTEAKKLREDLTVTGRLGLALLELGEHAAAATQLYRTVEEPAAIASVEERAQFFTAYQQARDLVCRLDVTLDRTGARVAVDGELAREGPADFWLFIEPGEHELRASLAGFEDDAKTIKAEPRARLPIAFTLKPKSTPQVVTKPLEEPPRAEVREDKPAPREMETRSRGRFVLGAAAAVVFGATPGAAVGPQIFGAWRRDWFSVGLEGRAAWGLEALDGAPSVRLVSWTVAAAPCAHWRVLFGCALVQMDWLAKDDLTSSAYLFLDTTTRLGFGLRGGVDVPVSERLHLLIWGDGVARLAGRRVQVGASSTWQGSSVLGTLDAGALVIF